jgi:hypothetical protein
VNLLTPIHNALEASFAHPVVSASIEEGVLGQFNPITTIASTLEPALASPSIPSVIQEGVLGYVNLLTAIIEALEASVTPPVFPVVDKRMLWDGRGILRPGAGWQQEGSHGYDEKEGGPTLKSLRIEVVHRSCLQEIASKPLAWSWSRLDLQTKAWPHMLPPREAPGG